MRPTGLDISGMEFHSKGISATQALPLRLLATLRDASLRRTMSPLCRHPAPILRSWLVLLGTRPLPVLARHAPLASSLKTLSIPLLPQSSAVVTVVRRHQSILRSIGRPRTLRLHRPRFSIYHVKWRKHLDTSTRLHHVCHNV